MSSNHKDLAVDHSNAKEAAGDTQGWHGAPPVGCRVVGLNTAPIALTSAATNLEESKGNHTETLGNPEHFNSVPKSHRSLLFLRLPATEAYELTSSSAHYVKTHPTLWSDRAFIFLRYTFVTGLINQAILMQ